MAVFSANEETRDIADGGRIMEVAESMGVPFGCHHGVCGACTVTVISGLENLGPKNEAEEDMDLDDDQRLMCQCSISGGTVKVEF